MSRIISLTSQNRKVLTLAGCYGVPCGGVYIVLSSILKREEHNKSQNLINLIKEEELSGAKEEQQEDTPVVASKPIPVQVEKSAREKVIDTVNKNYLTLENSKKQGGKHHFDPNYFSLPALEEAEKWDQILKQFQNSNKFKEDVRVKVITDVEEVKKYCLDELQWTDSTIQLDELQNTEYPSKEYLCVWNYFEHQPHSG